MFRIEGKAGMEVSWQDQKGHELAEGSTFESPFL